MQVRLGQTGEGGDRRRAGRAVAALGEDPLRCFQNSRFVQTALGANCPLGQTAPRPPVSQRLTFEGRGAKGRAIIKGRDKLSRPEGPCLLGVSWESRAFSCHGPVQWEEEDR